MRIVLDTNLWVSALLSQDMRERLEKLIENPDLVILGSPVLLAEIEAVAVRPKFARYFSPETTATFLGILRERLDLISPSSNVKICSDPKDDYLLAITKDGAADFLLTGDKDLLGIGNFEETKIISLTEFERM